MRCANPPQQDESQSPEPCDDDGNRSGNVRNPLVERFPIADIVCIDPRPLTISLPSPVQLDSSESFHLVRQGCPLQDLLDGIDKAAISILRPTRPAAENQTWRGRRS
jgi:hypothetical protein